MNVSEQTGASSPTRWVQSFGGAYLGLDAGGTVQRMVGTLTQFATPTAPLNRLTWEDVVTRFAHESARSGLWHLWRAVTERRVSPAHWPVYVPFRPGVIARLRVVENDPVVQYAVQLSPTVHCELDALIGSHMLEAMRQQVQLSQNTYRGVYGPLTDQQIEAVGEVLRIGEAVGRLLDDLHRAMTAPAITAPLPYPLKALFTFTERDFPALQRIQTHRLYIWPELSAEQRVYCHADIRQAVHHILEALLPLIEPQSGMTITSIPADDPATARVDILYRTQAPALLSEARVEPLPLNAAARFQPLTRLQELVTTAAAHVAPVRGQVWAEPTHSETATMRIGFVLPRWREDAEVTSNAV